MNAVGTGTVVLSGLVNEDPGPAGVTVAAWRGDTTLGPRSVYPAGRLTERPGPQAVG